MNKPKSIKVVTLYPARPDNPKLPGSGGDHYGKEIYFDGKMVVEYGDQYHDKGNEKVKAFLDAIGLVFGKLPKIKYEDAIHPDYADGE